MNGNGTRVGSGGSEVRRNLWRWVGLGLIVGGVVLLVVAGAYYAYIRISEARYAPLTSTVPPPASTPVQEPTPIATLAPTPGPGATPAATPQPTNTPVPSSPAVRIVIPSIDLDAKVVEVPSWNEVAKFAVGHYPTADPGEAGNVVMAGHLRSDLLNEGDIFKRLPDVARYLGITSYRETGVEKTTPADPHPVYISLYGTNGMEYRYEAFEALVVKPDSNWVLDPTPDETLTLITCVPEFSYDFRFVVRATRIS